MTEHISCAKFPVALNQHHDGLRIEWYDAERNGQQLIGFKIVEYRAGIAWNEVMQYEVPATPANRGCIQRMEYLANALCYYFNVGGTWNDLYDMTLDFHAFHHLVQSPAKTLGTPIGISYDGQRTSYYQLPDGQYFTVVDGEFSEVTDYDPAAEDSDEVLPDSITPIRDTC